MHYLQSMASLKGRNLLVHQPQKEKEQKLKLCSVKHLQLYTFSTLIIILFSSI